MDNYKIPVIEPSDYDVRNKIYTSRGNVVITASAGTGKTHTIIQKIVARLDDKKHFKKIAAITFTSDVAIELNDRVNDTKHTQINMVTCTTMHSWVVKEIIEPFSSNFYPIPATASIIPYFGKNFENIKTFEQGINQFRMNGYLLQYPQAKNFFTNKDKSFRYGHDGYDFIFDFALDIIKKSTVAQKYLINAYDTIFIDEYQDINLSQHTFFEYLSNELNICLFIVGDIKQEIFQFRGANPKYLQSFIDKPTFQHFELTHNFRSSQEIVEYSNIFTHPNMDNTINISWQDVNIISTRNNITLQGLISYLRINRPKESILVLFTQRKQNNVDCFDVIKHSDSIFTDFYIGKQLAYSESDNSDLLSELIKIIFSTHTLYDLDNTIKKSVIHKHFDQLTTLINEFVHSQYINFSILEKFINLLNTLLDRPISDIDYSYFKDAILDKEQLNSILDSNNKLRFLTVHGSKGLEADNVIIFGEDYIKDGNIKSPELHYVAITRAKKNLYILDATNAYTNMLEENGIL